MVLKNIFRKMDGMQHYSSKLCTWVRFSRALYLNRVKNTFL